MCKYRCQSYNSIYLDTELLHRLFLSEGSDVMTSLLVCNVTFLLTSSVILFCPSFQVSILWCSMAKSVLEAWDQKGSRYTREKICTDSQKQKQQIDVITSCRDFRGKGVDMQRGFISSRSLTEVGVEEEQGGEICSHTFLSIISLMSSRCIPILKMSPSTCLFGSKVPVFLDRPLYFCISNALCSSFLLMYRLSSWSWASKMLLSICQPTRFTFIFIEEENCALLWPTKNLQPAVLSCWLTCGLRFVWIRPPG